jgi:hypothetical protein
VAAGAGAVCETVPVVDCGGDAWWLIVASVLDTEALLAVVETEAVLLLRLSPPQPERASPAASPAASAAAISVVREFTPPNGSAYAARRARPWDACSRRRPR